MFFFSFGTKGGKWTGTLIFIDYNNNNVQDKTTLTEEKLLNYFKKLGTKEEKICKAKIWKHPLSYLPGIFGDWHEYTVVESTNWYWSFEKQMDAIYMQRSKNETDVKNKLDGEGRSNRIVPEGRSNDNVQYGENVYNIIEWIINRKALDTTYHITESNCHYFASLLYEAIVRDCGRRLDNTE
jgi:hypothetical protein